MEGETPLVLVVDDEELNLKLIEAILIPLGYAVETARDGEEAVQALSEGLSPDVILLDIMMPRMDGFEAAEHIKKNPATLHIPVVMVTALSEVEDRVRALKAGADDFLNKPVDRTELRARVQSLYKVKKFNDHMRDYQKTLEAEVEKKTQQLRLAFERIQGASLETLFRLSRAAEYKDEDTGGHIQRMSHYARAVAKRMGLSERTQEAILYASPMHDVGKIGIPDRILLKPGKLDADEWVVMKQHTVIGGRIFEGAKAGFVKLAQVIALTHHEKWNGSGYPNGLKGAKIPLAGRITAIADVFDALTSKRPYKEPFSLEKSFGIIREERGTHFDPDVVDAFFDIQDTILDIKENYTSEEDESLLLKMTSALMPRQKGAEA